MNQNILSGQLSWLGDALTGKRNLLSNLVSRLRGFGESVGNSLGWNKKVERLMEQIADEREKELDILNEIDKIEKRHQMMKQARLLKHADARLADKPECKEPQNNTQEEEAEFPLFAKLMGVFLFFGSSNRSQPNEQPRI